jgi:hypothetical protein
MQNATPAADLPEGEFAWGFFFAYSTGLPQCLSQLSADAPCLFVINRAEPPALQDNASASDFPPLVHVHKYAGWLKFITDISKIVVMFAPSEAYVSVFCLQANHVSRCKDSILIKSLSWWRACKFSHLSTHLWSGAEKSTYIGWSKTGDPGVRRLPEALKPPGSSAWDHNYPRWMVTAKATCSMKAVVLSNRSLLEWRRGNQSHERFVSLLPWKNSVGDSQCSHLPRGYYCTVEG